MTTNKKNKVTVFKTIESLNEGAAEMIADLAEKALKERGRFVICLSGGSTPKKVYSILSEKPYHDLLPWKNTFVFWSDERCVPMNDERNNAHMAFATLLKKVPVPLNHIFRIPVDMPPADAAKKYEETLRHFFGNEEPRFDLILLGLGENGHTASLFPGTAVLNEKKSWVKEVAVKDEVAGARITLTAPLINKARQILFLVAGAAKLRILEAMLLSHPEKYPAQLIAPEEGEALWFVDSHAASDAVMRLSVNDAAPPPKDE